MDATASFFLMPGFGRHNNKQAPLNGSHGNDAPLQRQTSETQKMYVCPSPGCDKAFQHIQHLRRHQNAKHGRIPTRRCKTNMYNPMYPSIGIFSSVEDGGEMVGRHSGQNFDTFGMPDQYPGGDVFLAATSDDTATMEESQGKGKSEES